MPIPQVPSVLKQWHVTYDVAKDGRASYTYTVLNQVALPSALEDLKSFAFSFSTGIQKGQMVEAYTLKQDGRRIEAPSGNHQTQVNDGRNGGAPLLSDRTRISVVFPDLAVGDSVGLTYRIDDQEAMFRGSSRWCTVFSYAVQGTARSPSGRPRVWTCASRHMACRSSPKRQKATPRCANGAIATPQPHPWDEADDGVWRTDETPVLLVSSFADYAAIARAYGNAPCQRPSPRPASATWRAPSSECRPIRANGRACSYEWVSTQITYGGNCIGVGAVVPRDTDQVLDNKMGDCKDHATLLQALLAAAGCAPSRSSSTRVSGMTCRATPVVSSVNHVINYLPDFGLYLDATAKQVPFGYLPANAYAAGHPRGARNALATIPAASADQTGQRVHTVLKLAVNGSASGSLRVDFLGTQAARMREYLRDLQGDAQRDFVRKVLASAGYKGQGILDRAIYRPTRRCRRHTASASASRSTTTCKAALKARSCWRRWWGCLCRWCVLPCWRIPTPRRQVRCYGYHSQETYDITLEPGVVFTRLPENLQTSNPLINYTGSYRRTSQGCGRTRNP